MKVTFGRTARTDESGGSLVALWFSRTPIREDGVETGVISASARGSDDYGMYSATMHDGRQPGGEYGSLVVAKEHVKRILEREASE